jgi:glycine cleavage system H protein
MVKKGLLYSETHEWIQVEKDFSLIGISDYAQESLGSIVFVDLPSVGDVFDKEEIFGAVESVKSASDLYAPVKIEILEINEKLADAPELLNEAPFDNWLLKVKVLDDKGLDDLLKDDQYEASCD